MNRILLVEDQREFQMIVTQILDDAEYVVEVAPTINAARACLAKTQYDLILLDITLPDQDGLDYYADLQVSEHKDIPVIFLTGSESVTHKITAFSLGAEDYITKPFNRQEFKARVHSKIRKHKRSKPQEVKIEPFHFKLASQRVISMIDGQEFELTPKEFKLLYCLASHIDKVFSREEILAEVWGTNVIPRTVDTTIYSMRKKIGALGDVIEAVPGIGYRYKGLDKSKKAA